MSRVLELRLLIILFVAVIMGHFLVNRRQEWDERLNQAFSRAWTHLGEVVDENVVRPDLNNNESEELSGENRNQDEDVEDGVQSVWGEESFRESSGDTCTETENRGNEVESQENGLP